MGSRAAGSQNCRVIHGIPAAGGDAPRNCQVAVGVYAAWSPNCVRGADRSEHQAPQLYDGLANHVAHCLYCESQNWMRLLCPERLAIDLKAQQARLEAEEKGKSERPVPTQAAEDESPRSQPTSEFRLDFSSLPEDKDPRAAAATTSTAPAAATSTGTSGGTNGRPITRSRTPKSARDTPSRTNKSRR